MGTIAIMDTIAESENDDAESKPINISDFQFVKANDNDTVIELINKVNAIINTKPITRGNIQSSIFNELKRINSDDAHNNLYTQSLILLLNVIILKYSEAVEIKSSNVPNFDDITNSEIKTMLETNKNKVTEALKKQIINILKLIETYPNKELKTKILDILNKIIELRLDRYRVKKHNEDSYYSESESNSDSESDDDRGNTTYIRRLAVSDTGAGSIQPPRRTSIGTLHKKTVINETITIKKIQTVFTVSTVSSEVLMGSKPEINKEGIITITKANLIAYINAHILILDETTKSNHYMNVPLFRLTGIFIFPESIQDSSSITDIILSTSKQESFGIKKLKINPTVWDTFFKYYVYMLTKKVALKIIVLLSILIFNFDFDKLENTFLSTKLESLNLIIKNIIDEYNLSLETNKSEHKPIVFVYNPNDTHNIITDLTKFISSIKDLNYKFKLFMIREYIRFAFYYSDTTKTSIASAITELLPQKNKYLKYKNKYLQLKKILNIN